MNNVCSNLFGVQKPSPIVPCYCRSLGVRGIYGENSEHRTKKKRGVTRIRGLPRSAVELLVTKHIYLISFCISRLLFPAAWGLKRFPRYGFLCPDWHGVRSSTRSEVMVSCDSYSGRSLQLYNALSREAQSR